MGFAVVQADFQAEHLKSSQRTIGGGKLHAGVHRRDVLLGNATAGDIVLEHVGRLLVLEGLEAGHDLRVLA